MPKHSHHAGPGAAILPESGDRPCGRGIPSLSTDSPQVPMGTF